MSQVLFVHAIQECWDIISQFSIIFYSMFNYLFLTVWIRDNPSMPSTEYLFFFVTIKKKTDKFLLELFLGLRNPVAKHDLFSTYT